MVISVNVKYHLIEIIGKQHDINVFNAVTKLPSDFACKSLTLN